MREAKLKNIPLISISAIFKPDQIYFRWYAPLFKETLQMITHAFVQDAVSESLLKNIGVKCTLSGDTRFDRVKAICDQKKDLPLIKKFKNGQKLLIIGSSWRQDLEVILPILITEFIPQKLKIIIAPHEVSESNISEIKSMCKNNACVLYSELNENQVIESNILIINNIGMLSSIYSYADYAYIGGAFGKGLHNILEAATFGMPIFFGPKFSKFKEANDLISLGSAFSIFNELEFKQKFNEYFQNENLRKQKSEISKKYVLDHIGATDMILNEFEEIKKTFNFQLK